MLIDVRGVGYIVHISERTAASLPPVGQATALFMMGYGLARFTVEFTREPDNFLGLLSMGLSMGQWLSLPMILIGALLWWHFSRQPAPQAN